MVRTARMLLATAIGLLSWAELAVATDVPMPTEPPPATPIEHPWTLTVVPYFWAAGLNGDMGVGGLPPVGVDASFSDIIDHLDFALAGITELRKGRFGLFSDLLYVDLGGEPATPHGILADSVSLDAKTLIFTAAAEYRLVDAPTGNLDVMIGARVWSVQNGLTFNGGPLNGISRSDTETWVDALAGVKGRIILTPKIFLTGWGMLGGGSSEFMWDVWGAAGYQFTDQFSMTLGWRALGDDYKNDGFVFDVTQQGPMFTAAYTF